MSDTYLEVFGKKLFGWRAAAALFGLVLAPPFGLGVVVGYLLSRS